MKRSQAYDIGKEAGYKRVMTPCPPDQWFVPLEPCPQEVIRVGCFVDWSRGVDSGEATARYELFNETGEEPGMSATPDVSTPEERAREAARQRLDPDPIYVDDAE